MNSKLPEPTKQTIRAAIERCLPDIPSFARAYAVEKLLEVFESYAQQREQEAYKKGYAQGGVDTILRHEKATKAVMAELALDTSRVDQDTCPECNGTGFVEEQSNIKESE